jgi:elongator complex protein 2
MTATAIYTSLGVNRASSCAACNSDGLLAFGAGKSVALWNSEVSGRPVLNEGKELSGVSQNNNGSGVHATLAGHAGQVTTVKLLNQVDGLASFVSGDTEGNVRIWEQSQDRSVSRTSLIPARGLTDYVETKFHCSLSFEAHPKSSISAIGFAPSSSESSQTILTGGSDGHVRVWAVSEGEAKEVQRIDFKGKLPLDIEVGHLPGTKGELGAGRILQMLSPLNSPFARCRSHREEDTALYPEGRPSQSRCSLCSSATC